MTRAPEDSLPGSPALAAPVGAADDLDIGPGGRTVEGAGFHLAGLRGVLVASGAGVDQLWLHPFRALRTLRIDGAGPAAARITPLGAERTIDLGGARIVERLVVARDAPVAFLEWRAADRGAVLDLSWETDLATNPAHPTPPAGTLRWARVPGGLAVGTPEADDGTGPEAASAPLTLFALHPDPDLDVGPGPGSAIRVRVTARLEPGTALRLAVGGGPAGRLGRTARMLGRPAVVANGRRGWLSRAAARRLAVEHAGGVPDQALAAAVEGLDALEVDVPDIGRSFLAGCRVRGTALPCAVFRTRDAVAAAGARLASGDRDPAIHTLALLARHQDGTGLVPAEIDLAGGIRPGTPEDAAAFVRLAAGVMAWTADRGAARRAWPAVARALDGAGLDVIRGAVGGRAALRALVPAAEELGDAPLADRLRETLGEAAAAAVGDVDPADIADPASAPRCPGGAADLAAAVDGVLRGLLGAEPDAPRGRLVLRPRPGERRAFRVRHLTMGDAGIGLDYHREDREGGAVAVHAFTVEQERGAVPVTLALEPLLPGTAVRAARVDGRAAELAPRREPGGWRVPVQLVLDHPRSVVVEMEQPVP